MDWIKYLKQTLPFLPVAALSLVIVGLVLVLVFSQRARQGDAVDHGRRVRQQMTRFLLTVGAFIVVLIVLSVIDATKDSATLLAGLLGIVFSAAITISSATFISNAMAGLMLRAVNNFGIGDYIQVESSFGRVTERGLFHIEIQTEDRDLLTMPNILLVSKPVKVVRGTGTIISATVSLGYDVPHIKVEEVLQRAGRNAELEDPFVYLMSLDDYSIVYQLAGFLPEVKHLLSARSRLRTCMLDGLHKAGIEIVSPAYINQRRMSSESVVVAPTAAAAAPAHASAPEDLMFDKADRAEYLEKLQAELAEIEEQVKKAAAEGRPALESRRESLRAHIAEIQEQFSQPEGK